ASVTFDQLEERLIASATRNTQMQQQNLRSSMSWAASGGQESGAQSSPAGGLRKIVDIPATYPDAARAARVMGVVILEITVQPDGTVSNARVMRSIPLLDAAAL